MQRQTKKLERAISVFKDRPSAAHRRFMAKVGPWNALSGSMRKRTDDFKTATEGKTISGVGQDAEDRRLNPDKVEKLAEQLECGSGTFYRVH